MTTTVRVHCNAAEAPAGSPTPWPDPISGRASCGGGQAAARCGRRAAWLAGQAGSAAGRCTPPIPTGPNRADTHSPQYARDFCRRPGRRLARGGESALGAAHPRELRGDVARLPLRLLVDLHHLAVEAALEVVRARQPTNMKPRLADFSSPTSAGWAAWTQAAAYGRRGRAGVGEGRPAAAQGWLFSCRRRLGVVTEHREYVPERGSSDLSVVRSCGGCGCRWPPGASGVGSW